MGHGNRRPAEESPVGPLARRPQGGNSWKGTAVGVVGVVPGGDRPTLQDGIKPNVGGKPPDQDYNEPKPDPRHEFQRR